MFDSGFKWLILRFVCLLITAYPVMVNARVISLDDILSKAMANAYDLKIAQTDIELSKCRIKEAISLYFPTLNARVNTEYLQDLMAGKSEMTAIGNMILSNNSRFQDSCSLNLSYNLLDFGVKRNRLKIAGRDVKQKELMYQQSLRDVTLSLLDHYVDLLLTHKELQTKRETLALEEELFQLKERLFKAGGIRRTELVDEAIRLGLVREDIERLKTKIWMGLMNISLYTGEDYDSEVIEPRMIDDIEHQPLTLKPQMDIESRIYELEIEKKKAELRILKRERLPQLGLYSNYTLYGSDRAYWNEALRDLRQRNWVYGIVVTIPLFEGFKSIADCRRLKLEISRLQLERDKEQRELQSRYERMKKSIASSEREIEVSRGLLRNMDEKTAMVQRLNNQQVIDRIGLLNQKIELVQRRLELEKAEIGRAGMMKRLKVTIQADEL